MSGYYIAAAILVFLGQLAISAKTEDAGVRFFSMLFSAFYLLLFVYGAIVL